MEIDLLTFDAFSITLSDGVAFSDGYLEIPGKLFEAGEYPDKGFSITEEELDEAIADFTTAPMDYEHKPGVLDGALGNFKNLTRDGKILNAVFEVPKFLSDFAASKKSPLKVSATWDKATKRLTGAAWVLNPRITDAQLVAAFSVGRHAPEIIAPASKTPRTLLSTERTPYMLTGEMKLREWRNKPENEGKFPTEDELSAMFSEDHAAAKRRAEEDKRQAEAKIAEDAAKFADSEIAAKRAYPFEKSALIAQFSRAAHDDAAYEAQGGGKITFSVTGEDGKQEEKQGTRVDMLKASAALRLPHRLDAELLSPEINAAQVAKLLDDPTKVVFSRETTEKKDNETTVRASIVAASFEQTPEGRAHLADKEKK